MESWLDTFTERYYRLIEYSAIIQTQENLCSSASVYVSPGWKPSPFSFLFWLLPTISQESTVLVSHRSGFEVSHAQWHSKKQQGCQPWIIITIMFVLIFFLTTIVPPGEEDEGAHPHDGLELADGKGFIAVRETRYQKLPLKHLWLRFHNISVRETRYQILELIWLKLHNTSVLAL